MTLLMLRVAPRAMEYIVVHRERSSFTALGPMTAMWRTHGHATAERQHTSGRSGRYRPEDGSFVAVLTMAGPLAVDRHPAHQPVDTVVGRTALMVYAAMVLLGSARRPGASPNGPTYVKSSVRTPRRDG